MKHRRSSNINGLILFTPERYHDERGYFQESFNSIEFYEALGKKVEFVQDNLSYSKKGVFRIHLQDAPHAQAKLVQVIKGSVVDFAIDLKPSIPTYLNGRNLNYLIRIDVSYGFLRVLVTHFLLLLTMHIFHIRPQIFTIKILKDALDGMIQKYNYNLKA